ncbi:hypothetical protein JTE90_021931 [Oedothorax gibbosus]|uniref:Uncharacterized protein n=1 Tax=Oedothorax gibbosus TaxID=931172 RepID=A0AAV6VWW0_9ARAC|nr:hypothetical protein JTE90_021931 [Oedothorax gibbosus]
MMLKKFYDVSTLLLEYLLLPGFLFPYCAESPVKRIACIRVEHNERVLSSKKKWVCGMRGVLELSRIEESTGGDFSWRKWNLLYLSEYRCDVYSNSALWNPGQNDSEDVTEAWGENLCRSF